MGEGKMIQGTIYSTRGHRMSVFQTKRIYVGRPVAMWSERWFCVPLLAGIAVLNSVDGVDVTC